MSFPDTMDIKVDHSITKGNLQLMTNYRGITLMSIAAKTYNKVLLNCIRNPIDKILKKYQAGSRPDRSCTEQIHILRRIMQGAVIQEIPLFITFIDCKKTLDPIDRDLMFAILLHYETPAKTIAVLQILYNSSKNQVDIEGLLPEPFNVTTGLLQGNVCVPFLLSSS